MELATATKVSSLSHRVVEQDINKLIDTYSPEEKEVHLQSYIRKPLRY
jgi:hypothetical protein